MRYGDLSQPMHLGKKYEWVMSLEVAEHVPKKYEANFVENLIRHACKGQHWLELFMFDMYSDALFKFKLIFFIIIVSFVMIVLQIC